MRWILVAVVGLAVSSCAVLPNSEKVTAFGNSASATADAVKASVAAHYTIALRVGEEQQADKLLTGETFTLADAPDTTLSAEQLSVRFGAIEALQQYAAALVVAADKQTITELENASAALGSAVGAAGSVAVPAAAPIIAPTAKLASRVVGLGLGHAYAGEIQAIIVARDDDVAKLTQMLTNDVRIVATHLAAQNIAFRNQRRVVLARIATDPRVDDLRIYEEYKRARAEVVAIQTLSATAARLPGLLSALADAHHKLATGSADAEEAVRQFAALADDLSLVIEALKASA